MFNIIITFILGISAGTLTGLLPGIHTNLIAAITISNLNLLTDIPTTILVIFIISMATTHTFLDFIPSIYLGAPDEDTALSVLPGHKFLLKGKAHQAVLLTLIGSTLAIVILIILTPILLFLIPKITPFIQRMMSWILIWISIFLISKEKHSKLWAIIIFILSGFLGISTMNIQINQPLLPLLTGLFGSSSLVYSISKKIKIPKQKIGKLIIPKKKIIKPILSTIAISPTTSFLPGLGSSQAAIIASSISQFSQKQFLIFIGSANTLTLGISIITLYLINKSRTGIANFIQQVTTIDMQILIIILVTIVFASIVSIPLTILISKTFAKHITKINYTKISIIILTILLITTLIFSGIIGLLIFLTATLLGYLTILLGIRRGHLMGALLIPTILFYLPIN